MSLSQNLAEVQARIERACAASGRLPASVRLMAVSKGHPPEVVCEAARLGLTLFGENRVQEAKAKIPLCPSNLHWHLIGHLQSNKCRDAATLFEMVQSIDRLDVACELNRWAEKLGRHLPILLEVNVAGEASKFGFTPDAALQSLEAINRLPRLAIHGLMAIPPWSPDPETVRPCFRKLAELRRRCEDLLGAPLAQLSMGMSADLEVAIEEGSTLVRVGTALFGERVRPIKSPP